jgi:hypothetical protein
VFQGAARRQARRARAVGWQLRQAVAISRLHPGERTHGALLGRCEGAYALVSDRRDYVAPSSNSSTTRDIRRGILARSVG